jgi:glycine/D-amino acid oxidase-like deaminating enzyme
MASLKVVIVGGGVIGLSAAYQLAASGAADVTLIEKDTLGAGSSRRAAGITSGLLWSETGVRARRIGVEWFRRLSHELPGYHYHDEHGCLNLFTPDTWPQRQPLLKMYDRLELEYRILSAAEIHRQWPDLTPQKDMIGLHDPNGGYSEPDDYVDALARRVRELGVQIIENNPVREFLTAGGRVSGVRTENTTFHADAVISSLHSWGPLLWKQLDLRLPVKSFVHQRFVSEPLPHPFVAPPVNADPYLGYIRPAHGGRMLLGVETTYRPQFDVAHPDFRMDELTIDPALRDESVQRMSALSPLLDRARWESQRIGLIVFSQDGEPILGPVKHMPGLFVAGSFHSGGFSYNTVAGLLLSELVLGKPTSVDITTFSPDRFDRASTDTFLAQPATQANVVRRRH